MSLKALIWDVDGTLAETEEAHRRAFNQAFAEARLPWRWDKAAYAALLAVSGGKERIAFYLDTVRRRDGAGFLPRLADLHARKTAHYAAMLAAGHVRLRPGVKRLLTEAKRAGLKLAVATTTTAANVQTLLAGTMGKDAPAWDAFVAGDAVPRKKPAADVYLAVLAALGLAPDACIAIEDSRNGLLAASAANVACIITPSTYAREENFHGALAVLESLGDADHPCRVLAGPALASAFVDVAQLRTWRQDK